MTPLNRSGRLGGLAALAFFALFAGCKPEVTGKNVMPDDPNMSASQKRQAMMEWHKQHDKAPMGLSQRSGQ
jgi:hypothetical protein